MITKAAVHRKKCKACRKNLKLKSRATFCSDSCRKNQNRKKNLESNSANFTNTAFGQWVICQIKRAGTVQILEGVDLIQLYNTWGLCRNYNGFNNNLADRYTISHICPVKNDSGVVATLHHKNIVIAPTSYNCSRKNAWNRVSGVYVEPRNEDFLSISADSTAASIYSSIKRLCGNELTEFLSTVKLVMSASSKLADSLKKVGCPVDVTQNTSYELLKTLWDRYAPDEYHQSFCVPYTLPEIVYYEEALRLGAYIQYGEGFHRNLDWDYLHGTFVEGKFVYVLSMSKYTDGQRDDCHVVSSEGDNQILFKFPDYDKYVNVHEYREYIPAQSYDPLCHNEYSYLPCVIQKPLDPSVPF